MPTRKVWSNRSMSSYRERLWPSPALLLALLLLIPATLLVFVPINPGVGLVVAVLLYVGSVGFLVLSSPRISVGAEGLTVGAAHLAPEWIGTVTWFDGTEATAERGVRLDARAWLAIRGGIAPVVRVDVTDTADPTPYWLISSRRPAELAEALSNLSTR